MSASALLSGHKSAYPSLLSFERSLHFPMALTPLVPAAAIEMHDIAALQLREAVERRDANAVEKILNRLDKVLHIDLEAFLNERINGLTYLEEALKVQPRWLLRSMSPEAQAKERRKKNSSLRLVELLVEKGANRLDDAAEMTNDPAIVYYLKDTAKRRRIEQSARSLLFYIHDGS